MIENYLQECPTLHGVIQIVDLRHPPTDLDVQMFEWLQAEGIPTTVVATKADKLGRSKWEAHRKICAETLLLEDAPREALIVASSETGESKDRIWSVINHYLALPPLRNVAPIEEEAEDE
ncbi:putative GTP-binding protein EngB [compost metagenome]